jgi:hypothetical protein
MMENALVLAVVECTEFEQGWGQRPDGYYGFLTEEEANEFIRAQTKDRTGPVPYIYTHYEYIGLKETTKDNLLAVTHSRRKHFNRLEDLKK